MSDMEIYRQLDVACWQSHCHSSSVPPRIKVPFEGIARVTSIAALNTRFGTEGSESTLACSLGVYGVAGCSFRRRLKEKNNSWTASSDSAVKYPGYGILLLENTTRKR